MSESNPGMPSPLELKHEDNGECGQGKAPLPVNSSNIDADELRRYLHDLMGPLASARGFSEELVCTRQCMQDLIRGIDAAADCKQLDSLKHQIDNEMEYCLDRVERSLVKLDAIIELIRVRNS